MGCKASKDVKRTESSGGNQRRSLPESLPDLVTDPPKGTEAAGQHGAADNTPSTTATTKAALLSSDCAIAPGTFITQQRAHLSDRYQRERKLGSGAYGEVLLCRDKQTGAERAVKIIKKSTVSGSSSQLLEEVAVVKQLDHPNIMKLYEFFDDKRNYYLVMELYRGGELFDEIINRHRFSEADAADITKQVLSGVTYLHKMKIVHRDLKPENLLLESKAKDAMIKIVDFGLSAHFDPTQKLRDRLGTAYYIAPEVLRKKYDEKCDVWSIGVILFILLCGYPPFGGQTDSEILRRVEKGKFAFDPPEWTKVSDEAKHIIKQMLTYDPARRISAQSCLEHEWICNYAQRQDVEKGVLTSALGNMKRFQGSQKLAQAALLFIGSKLTTIEETKELTVIFRQLDKNGDGQLDRDELIQGYDLLIKTRPKEDDQIFVDEAQIEEEIDQILRSVDFDNNGYIEYSEFVTVCMDRRTLLSKERLHAAFQVFDTDGSGTISAAELASIFGLNNVDDATWNSILSDVDQNNDGEVDFEEFVLMMQKMCLNYS